MNKIITAAICAATLGGFAETTNTLDAARVVVTATRNTAPIRSIANNPSVITSEDLERGHYTSIPEALQKKAGVFVSRISDTPSQAQVNLRGFGGDAAHQKTLVLLNGRKLNRPDMATINWCQIPMQAVERIEVIRGPNSVLYGDHAVGGVINIITKQPSEIPATTLSASFASDEKYEQSLTTSGKLEGLGYVATLGHQSGDGYRDRSAYDSASGSIRLSGNINERVSAYTEISAVKEQHQLPGALTNLVVQSRKQAQNPDDAAREEFIHLQAGVDALLTEDLIFNLDGGISQKDLEADIASWFTYYDYKFYTYTLSPKFTILTPAFGLENELIAGIDLKRETLDTQKYYDKARSALWTDTEIKRTTIGGYVADTLQLTDQLLLSGGLRMEKNKLKAQQKTGAPLFDEESSDWENAWQSALTWLPTDTVKVFAGIDRTYRYASFDEQISYSGYGTDGFNKNLKPETGMNYEIGVEYLPASNIMLQATLFRTDMEDEIAWDWSTYQNVNLEETTHSGLELSAAYTHELFALNTYYTWLQSEFAAGANKGNEIPWVPQHQLDINLALFVTDDLTLHTHMSYLGSMFQSGDNSNTGDNHQSEYALFDLLLQYELPTDKIEATVFAGIDNIFATEYNYLVSWGGYYPAPERTYKAGLSLTF
ncbi:TonB-dependent receptor [Tichowtungia aerotolerans]|uniref:TonB-dependent receptor n=1 Tax=Tichowtungia aerotolerans TaxID=2697043 RepID=A0A6P1M7W3_9BACT|nr:TonB-dependent receptor [Tichowtungia aerotolerans]QHI70799.1 TonB-dependent receptor [Tichowtungia aerotolerans]